MSENRISRKRVVAPAMVATLTSVSVGHAQSFMDGDFAIPTLPDTEYVARQSGPIDAAVKLVVDGNVGGEWESNIFKAPRGAEVSDFVYTASVRAAIRFNGDVVNGKIEVGADTRNYARNSSNDQVDLFLRGNLDFAVSQTTSITTRASIKQNNSGQPYFEGTGTLGPREKTTTAKAEIGVDHRGQQWNARGAIGFEIANFEGIEDTGDPMVFLDNSLRDNRKLYARAELGKNLNAQSEIFGGFEVATVTFNNSAPLSPARDSFKIEPYIGYRNESLDGSVTAEAKLGLAVQNFSNAVYDNIVTPTFDASVKWVPQGQGFELYAGTETRIKETLSVGVGSVVEQSFELGGKVEVSNSIHLLGEIYGDYQIENVSDAFGGGSGADYSVGVSVGMRYYPWDNVYVATKASYEQSFDSNGLDYDNAIIGVSLGADY